MIRKFHEDDLESVMQLWLDTNRSTHFFIHESYWRDHYIQVKQFLPQATLCVDEQDHIIRGFIGLIDNTIAGIFVSLCEQSKGIGRALLNHVKKEHTTLTLSVYQKNNRAIQFYLRENFIIESNQIDLTTKEAEFVMKWHQ